MKISLSTVVTYMCDTCGAARIGVAHEEEPDSSRHELAVRAVARAQLDALEGGPPSAWALENMPAGWTALIRVQLTDSTKLVTLIFCSATCVARHLYVTLGVTTPLTP